MKRHGILALIVCGLVLSWSALAFAMMPVFSRDYVKVSGKPLEVTETFSVPPSFRDVRIQAIALGDEADVQQISLSINGDQLRSKDVFDEEGVAFTPQPQNTLIIKIHGNKHKGSIGIRVIGVPGAPRPQGI